jgi:hypothetical protein
MTTQELETLALRFRQFAELDSKKASPLYTQLSMSIADDPELLALAAHARPEQPVPNLLFGAVHFLLLKGTPHPLAKFYPGMTNGTVASGNPFPYFRAFCLEHRTKIEQIITTRLVQTNEVRRCALLLPAFTIVAKKGQNRSLSLIEIGASAGLNLLWDHYGYDYGEGQHYGDMHAPVQLTCRLRGEKRPPLPDVMPQVATRIGIDLNPIDVRDEEATLWLRALIWPEQEYRATLLQRALHEAQKHPPQLIAGDALEQLPSVIAAVPPDTALCLFHTFVLNQFSPQAREQLDTLIAQHATQRDIYVVSITWLVGEMPQLSLATHTNQGKTEQTLAYCSGHGHILQWL